MQLSDFHFDLPDDLIAQLPLQSRSASRLLVQNGQNREHRQFTELPSLLRAGDLLVFNDTRVIPARLFGTKTTGGKLELLIERVISRTEVLTKIRASKSLKPGAQFQIADATAKVVGREHDLFVVQFELSGNESVSEFIDAHGEIPLPPYIHREPDTTDEHRYQTVYAKHAGAVAAPTAGLHFDKELLAQLDSAGIEQQFVTLHVGSGTFMPVRVDNIQNHVMHAERVQVSAETVAAIQKTKQAGGRVIAVGTTSVRALESASASGQLAPYNDETSIFITPGSRFNVIDGMITNFHLPESTLLMLVSAFGGYNNTMAAYQEAVKMRYRFFSYGDATLVWPAATI